ncbi:hypothetical protein BCR41DRAFT_347039 [Lobosporangium transversale]|uniref:Uncharacterized protein n=1 Tax=Lobosporangium transversale TaxID=64571 RepID=A0A1Y2H1H5_9FUNG|nr:hypothetical protein BCR41DRAFT_347039 [Lobosporangium transversale]ORZ26902.1 hypothetical protein BCR41DRAFT_347039 [Lobosporangium transversale]|eukprot:XP_021884649.1 hypothetical protein BCR41DRAFT_347039 [Lobosporangium transversale]
MPPQKTQKTSHTPSSQLIETTPLNPITNFIKRHSRIHSLPGTGKGKQVQEKPLAKPQTSASAAVAASPEKPSPPTQTHLDFTKKPKHCSPLSPQEQNASQKDLEIVRKLENELEEVKRVVMELQQQAEQEETKLHLARSEFQKEEDDLMERIDNAEKEQVEVKAQVADQEQEIEKHSKWIDELEQQVGEKTFEADVWRAEVEKYEAEIAEKIMFNELDEERLVLEALELEREEVMARLEENDKKVQKLREKSALVAELIEQIKFISDAEAQLEDADFDLEGAGLQMKLDLSIEQEFEALRSRYSLSKGSDMDKEVAKYQARLTSKFNRHLSSLILQHNVKKEQVAMKTRAHEARLQKLQINIEDARRTIDHSKGDFKEAERERQEIRSKMEATTKEIEEVRKQLACF